MELNSLFFLEIKKESSNFIKCLLYRQKLLFFDINDYQTNFLKLLDKHASEFQINSSELIFCIQNTPKNLLASFISKNENFHMHNNPASDFSTEIDFLSTENSQMNIHLMTFLAKLKSIQIKMYSIFDFKLTSRKIGLKGHRKIYVFSNQQNQLALLVKIPSLPKTFQTSSSTKPDVLPVPNIQSLLESDSQFSTSIALGKQLKNTLNLNELEIPRPKEIKIEYEICTLFDNLKDALDSDSNQELSQKNQVNDFRIFITKEKTLTPAISISMDILEIKDALEIRH